MAGSYLSTLVPKNLYVDGRRTSIRLEPEMWDAITDIATRETLSINEIVSRVDRRRQDGSLTASLRVFILAYYRQLGLSQAAETQAVPGAARVNAARTKSRSSAKQSPRASQAAG
jgi:predicted DNA-binding ribbon-helix-helix protein